MRKARPARSVIAVCVLGLISLLPATAGAAEVDAGSLRAEVGEDPWGLSFVDPSGTRVLDEHSGTGPGPSGTLGFEAEGVWRHATRVVAERAEGDSYVAELATTDPLRRMQVRVSPDAEGVIRVEASVLGERTDVTALGIGFEARPDERYLGFGERSNSVDQRGNEVENYVGEGPYPVEERPFVAGIVPFWGYQPRDDATYFPVPWLLSTAGYGVLIDNIETSYFRLTSDSPDAWSLEVRRAPPNQPQGAPAPAPEELSFRVFGGPRPTDVLRRFTDATGRQPPTAAPWYLGPWIQPVGGRGFRGRVDELRAADAPVSVAQTYTRYLPCGVHEGNRDRERGRTNALHAAGVAVTTYLNPMICTSYQPRYGEAAAGNGLTRNQLDQPYVYRYPTATFFASDGDLRYFEVSQFDFSAEAGRSVFRSVLADAIEDGYDGWMEDYGEYTPLDSRSANGMDGTRMHNLYPVQYHCVAQDFANEQARPLGRYIRSGFTGVAPCAQIVWGGDPTTAWGFDGLESAVTNGLTMGLSGISTWGSDIGGLFANGTNRLTPELKIRWIQFGAVSGVMRDQAGQFAVPDTEEKERPQIWDPEILPHWRRYAKLRTQLYPYLVAADSEYQRTGLPIMRHLALVYPRDAVAMAREDEFMFGPDLLAAPVVEPGAVERELYLPEGRWVDMWRSITINPESGGLRVGRATTIDGGRPLTVPAPLEELPLFARAGTILPLLPPDTDTLADYGAGTGLVKLSDRLDQLDLLAFPRGASSAEFYRGERLVSREQRNAWRLTIIGNQERTYRLEASLSTLRNPLEPCRVSLDGTALESDQWRYEPERAALVATVATRSGTLAVRGCGGDGDAPDPPSGDPPTGGFPPAGNGGVPGRPCSNGILGTSRPDWLGGTPASDRVLGKDGRDRIEGKGGDDCLRGGAGRDRIGGGRDDDVIRGGRGEDVIKGGAGDDKIRAARGGRDRIACGPGRDKVFINRSRDRVNGSCERLIR